MVTCGGPFNVGLGYLPGERVRSFMGGIVKGRYRFPRRIFGP